MVEDHEGNEVEPDPADGSHLVINCTSGEFGRADTEEERDGLLTFLDERSEILSAQQEERAAEERREHARLQLVAQRRAKKQGEAMEELKARADAGDVTAELFLRALGHDA